jgi:putative DNA primase/helicase
MYREPLDIANLAQLNARILQLLKVPLVYDDNHVLKPTPINFSPPAQALWIEYHDTIERQLSPDGAYCEVKDVAAKSAENVARLAALFHLLIFGRGASIDDEIMRQAIDVGQWYLNETQSLLREMAVPPICATQSGSMNG